MPVLTVVVDQLLAPVPGGTGRYTREITAALAAAPRPGWGVRTVTSWHRDPSAARIGGADGPRRLPVGRRVLAEVWSRGWPPSVGGERVHATTPLAPARRGGLVVTVHDAVPWTHPETLTPRGVQWHRMMIGRDVRRAESIVVPSTAVADDLSGIFPALADRIRVIAHGVTALPVPPDAAAVRARLGVPDGYVLAIATLEPRKGLDVLIDALARPVTRAHLVVVGPTGWGDVDVARTAAAAGLGSDRLHAVGRLDDRELAAVLAGAAVLAAPSRAEGFGLPVLEAMAAGVPVVVSDAPALVELVGPTGLVSRRDDPVALAEAIGGVLADATLADDLAARGRARAAGYTWAAAADRVWDLHVGHRR
jgi:glycosyltransferase involved in cell wall biosynthesis